MSDRSQRASSLLDSAIVDPATTMADGARLLGELNPGELVLRSTVNRAMSMAAKVLGDHHEAIELARAAIELGVEAGDAESEVLGLLALAAPLSISGDIPGALEATGRAAGRSSDPYLRARCMFQEAQILTLEGELPTARDAYLEALTVFRRVGDQNMVRGALGNLGYIDTLAGELARAETELSEALEIAIAREEEVAISGISHNLGVLASYRGDLVGALEHLERSEAIFMEITGASAPQHVARAEVLISAGLFREALALARALADANRSSGDAEHEGNALLVAAQAALLCGEPEQAEAMAALAMAALGAQGRPGRAAEAAATFVQARLTVDGASPDLVAEARRVVDDLERVGAVAAAGSASLVAARAALDLGDHDTAALLLRKVAAERTGPVELRVSGWVARALLALEAGDKPGAGRAIREGLALVDRYQAALGATDLRMGIERQSRDLATLGMGLALESRNARRILAWMDGTRARSLRHRPVSPSGDTGLDELLARLRQVEAGIRQTGTSDEEQTRQRRRLQDEIAGVARSRRGGDVAGGGVTVAALLDILGDTSLIELGVHDGILFGIHARDGRVRRFELGDYGVVVRELEHLRFAMRLSARRGRSLDPAPLADLDRRVLGGIELGDEPVVIVPHPGLMALPWAALPRLRGRTLSVSPSAEMWARARGRNRREGRIVVVGGPDLTTAHREVREVGRVHSSATVLEPGVGVVETWEALDGAALAHVASHAIFAVENPMFSSLRLGDGDLNVYDLERLYRPPDLVVLSACDSGYSETRAGDELTGLTSALLSMGTRNVVASVGLVPDSDATPDLMVTFHEGLVQGAEPASALARAQETMFADPDTFVVAASFICVGA